MNEVTECEAVQRLIGTVSRAVDYTSNLYVGPDQVARWCAAAPLHTIRTSNAVLLLRSDRDFQRVYHVAANLPALTGALETLPAGRYVADLVGKREGVDRIRSAYDDAGFHQHAFLARMGRTQDPAVPQQATTLAASPADVPAVADFLDRLLDRFSEQLPDESELSHAATDGRLLIVRRPDGIAGMLMYDLQGQSAHLRFWHVDENARGTGVGRQLMTAFLARCAHARRIILWVIGTNDRSIAIYQHYGFAADGLLDRIMISHKDRHS